MMKNSLRTAPPLFELAAETTVAAPPDKVYAIVSDLRRSGEWSPECVGGSWVSGEPGAVGSVFRGENLRGREVVAWAPVVRGTWFTESEVVVAEPGLSFQWSMRNKAGVKQDSVWAYDIVPTPSGGSIVTHRFRMGSPTEGIGLITADMDDTEKKQFFADWSDKLAHDLPITLQRLKHAIERSTT